MLWTTWICLLAFAVFTVLFKSLKGVEKGIYFIVVLVLIGDLTSGYYMSHGINKSGLIYNLLTTIQAVMTFGIYWKHSDQRWLQKVNLIGIVLVILIRVIGTILNEGIEKPQIECWIVAALVIAILSYLNLKNEVLNKATIAPVITAFCLANFLYNTLMISSMSSVNLAYELDPAFAKLIYLGNDIGYALWSITLIIGILWKKLKT